jgi:transcriptional regulator with XRE-family HTH domain
MAKRKKLNEKQLAAIAILSLPDRGGLTYKQVAERVGVAESTIHEWRKLDHFNDEIKKQVLRNAVADLPNIYASIPRHIIDEGNAAMFRTYVQTLGMLTEKVEINDSSEGASDVESIKAELERLRQRKNADN